MNKARKRLLQIGCAIAVVLAGLLVYLVAFAEERDGTRTARTEARSAAVDPLRSLRLDPALIRGVDLEQLVSDYRAWAAYPPNSRPLLPAHTDVLDFRVIRSVPQEMPARIGPDLRPSGFSCTLQPEHHTVVEGESMDVYLSCSRSGKRARLPLRIREVRVEGVAGVRRFRPTPPAGDDNGSPGDRMAGDGVYTFRFLPRPADWGDIGMTVNFQIPEDPLATSHSLRTHFFSSPVAPAHFTGAFRESREQGSLVVSAEVDVRRRGRYTVEANLMAGKESVAYARAELLLPVGRHFVPLQFFGRILRERGLAGPYRVVGLRGSLSTDAIQPEMLAGSPADVDRLLSSVRQTDPKKMIMPYYKKDFETAAYPISEFSDREYDSPEKRGRLEALRALR